MRVERILCPLDYSHASSLAFEYAADLAELTHAELILLHVCESPEVFDPRPGDVLDDAPAIQHLNLFQSRHPGVHVTRLVQSGHAGEAICRVTQDQHCDLIVLGTKPKSSILRALLGGVADHVLAHAPCPVLTVRESSPA